MTTFKYSVKVRDNENKETILGDLILSNEGYEFNGQKQTINWEKSSYKRGVFECKHGDYSSEMVVVMIICEGDICSPTFLLSRQQEEDIVSIMKQFAYAEREKRLKNASLGKTENSEYKNNENTINSEKSDENKNGKNEILRTDLSIDSDTESSEALFAPGKEPEDIRIRLERLFAKLDEFYPNKTITGLNKNHKKTGENVTALYRLLGYSDAQSFLEAYGYSYETSAGGRPESVNPESIIAQLKKLYPNGTRLSVSELQQAHPNIPWNSFYRKTNSLYGLTLTKYLIREGVLLSEPKKITDEEKDENSNGVIGSKKTILDKSKEFARSNEKNSNATANSDAANSGMNSCTSNEYADIVDEKDEKKKLDGIIAILKKKYVDSWNKPSSIGQLKYQNPDLPVTSLEKLIKKVYNKTMYAYLAENRIVAQMNQFFDDDAMCEDIKIRRKLQRAYFRTELPITDLCRYYSEKYLEETVSNPYFKNIPRIEKMSVQYNNLDSHSSIKENNHNNCYIEDKILISCERSECITVPDGIEIIGPSAFSNRNPSKRAEHIYEVKLPDSVRMILYPGYEGFEMNIPKGYLLNMEPLPDDTTRDYLGNAWKNKASILDWVSIYLTQNRKLYREKCEEAFEIEKDSTAAAFIAFLNVHSEEKYVNDAYEWIFGNKSDISHEILVEFYNYGKRINNKKIIETFSSISSIQSNENREENDKLYIENYIKTYDNPIYQKILKDIKTDIHYKNDYKNDTHIAAIILTKYLDEWDRCSTTFQSSMSNVNVLRAGTKLKPIKICDDLIERINRDNFIDYLKSKVITKVYRNYIIPFAYFASEEDILWFIEEISQAQKGHAQDRYRAESSVQAMFLSKTGAAVIYFDKNDSLSQYARMYNVDEDELRIKSVFVVDLDENGQKIYDLGNNKIKLQLKKDLSVSVTDMNTGKETKSVPKKDIDSDKYLYVKSDFEKQKNDIEKIAKAVNKKLLSDYLSRTKYSPEKWKSLFLSNVVPKYISELIVWSQGKHTFVITESGCITSDNSVYKLSDEEILIMHPMEVDSSVSAFWQEYFSLHNLKQPFDQIWEPVIDFGKISSDRYIDYDIPLYRFDNRKEHGINLEKQSEYNYRSNSYEYSSIRIAMWACNVDWELTDDYERAKTLQSTIKIKNFEIRINNRRSNHIIAYLDMCAAFSKIDADDPSVLNIITAFTLAQINELIKYSVEKGSKNCENELLEYREEHWSEFTGTEGLILSI